MLLIYTWVWHFSCICCHAELFCSFLCFVVGVSFEQHWAHVCASFQSLDACLFLWFCSFVSLFCRLFSSWHSECLQFLSSLFGHAFPVYATTFSGRISFLYPIFALSSNGRSLWSYMVTWVIFLWMPLPFILVMNLAMTVACFIPAPRSSQSFCLYCNFIRPLFSFWVLSFKKLMIALCLWRAECAFWVRFWMKHPSLPVLDAADAGDGISHHLIPYLVPNFTLYFFSLPLVVF